MQQEGHSHSSNNNNNNSHNKSIEVVAPMDCRIMWTSSMQQQEYCITLQLLILLQVGLSTHLHLLILETVLFTQRRD
jgi:hypothetical protein